MPHNDTYALEDGDTLTVTFAGISLTLTAVELEQVTNQRAVAIDLTTDNRVQSSDGSLDKQVDSLTFHVN